MASSGRKSCCRFWTQKSIGAEDPNRGKVMVPPLNRLVSFRVVKPNIASVPASGQPAPCLLNTQAAEEAKVYVEWNLKSDEVAAFESDNGVVELGINEAATLKKSRSTVRQRTCSRGGLSIADLMMPLPAYDDGQDIEYFSITHQQWLNATVHSEAASSSDRSNEATVLTTVTLSSGGQIRENIGLDLLRPPFQPGELVELFSGRDGGVRLPATIAQDQLLTKPSNRGYRVVVDGTGEVFDNVPSLRLKRRFVGGQNVEVYRGPQCGWILAKVHHAATPDGCGAEMLPLPSQIQTVSATGSLCPGLSETPDAEAAGPKHFTVSDIGLWTLVPVCTENSQEEPSPEWWPSYLICLATDPCANPLAALS